LKTFLKFIICVCTGFGFVMIMSYTAPKILWLRMTLLLIIMAGCIQFFYFWVKPVNLKQFNIRWISVFVPAAAFLTYFRHGVMAHDLRPVHLSVIGFAAALPLICGLIYRAIQRQSSAG
jgi:hypothetical protein